MAGPYFEELIEALGPEQAADSPRASEAGDRATAIRLRELVKIVRASIGESGEAASELQGPVERLQTLSAAYTRPRSKRRPR